MITFLYKARSDWLKQCTLSENRARVDDVKLAFNFFLGNFDDFDRKLNIPCNLDKRNVNELFVRSKYGSRRTLLAAVVQKLYEKN